MNVYLLSHANSQLNSDGTANINAYNLKEARGFDIKFHFDCVMLFKDLLSHDNRLLVAFQQGIIYQGFSFARHDLSFYIEGNNEEHVLGKC